MSESMLAVEGLEKYFPIRSGLLQRVTGHVKAVDGVSFSIDRGETLALIGESGSGKSTVAKTIIGIHEATGGQILFDGEDVTDPDDDQREMLRSRMQMVFQDPTSSLNPRRSVKQTLSVPLKAKGVSRSERSDRIRELLTRVELNEEYLYKHPHELSGGQKQRVNIARALAVDPDVLLLDEPTSALDVSVQAKIISLLDELQAELNLTYLFITHDLSLVRNVADETAVMYLGQIQESGDTRRIFTEPRHPYTQALLSAIPVTSDEEERYKPRKEPLEGEIPSPRDIPDGCRFHTRCPYATDVCREVEPALVGTTGARANPAGIDGDEPEELAVRCHIYDADHRDTFEEIPEVAVSGHRASTDGGEDGA
jgi:oligopeptide/dipeptide ABC transporter ATP-binding protein